MSDDTRSNEPRITGTRDEWVKAAQREQVERINAQAEVDRLRNVIRTGGAMYRAERAAMGIPGGHDADVDKASGEPGEWFREQAKAICQGYGITMASSVTAIAALLLDAYHRGRRERSSDYPPASVGVLTELRAEYEAIEDTRACAVIDACIVALKARAIRDRDSANLKGTP